MSVRFGRNMQCDLCNRVEFVGEGKTSNWLERLGPLLRDVCRQCAQEIHDRVVKEFEQGLVAASSIVDGKGTGDVPNLNLRIRLYYLQNSYQDSGWEDLSGRPGSAPCKQTAHPEHGPFSVLSEAVDSARELSKNSIAYGTVRVVDDTGVERHVFSNGDEVVPF